MRQTKEYCHKAVSYKGGNYYRNFYPNKKTTELCGVSDPIVTVLVTECEESPGCYWGWWDNKDEKFHFVNSHRAGVEICFPYGTKAEEKRGRGHLLPVSIVEVDEDG